MKHTIFYALSFSLVLNLACENQNTDSNRDSASAPLVREKESQRTRTPSYAQNLIGNLQRKVYTIRGTDIVTSIEFPEIQEEDIFDIRVATQIPKYTIDKRGLRGVSLIRKDKTINNVTKVYYTEFGRFAGRSSQIKVGDVFVDLFSRGKIFTTLDAQGKRHPPTLPESKGVPATKLLVLSFDAVNHPGKCYVDFQVYEIVHGILLSGSYYSKEIDIAGLTNEITESEVEKLVKEMDKSPQSWGDLFIVMFTQSDRSQPSRIKVEANTSKVTELAPVEVRRPQARWWVGI